ncbi:hypothetical protein OH799_10030 [Nocardia sp. NBC_00881]|uniref:hypothetical protein n=1 Tax=Nocardia sp. NBC_00881 TaxID=2975995 RepID=UPI00386B71CA|nr:hypothetical protein OH799_10030 [Nocardia sp. NBC_00881]
MDLRPYLESLRYELVVAADAGGDEARELAERLTSTLNSATRLALLNALSDAADEITRDLAPGSVEVRLRGVDPTFVVTPPPSDQYWEEDATVAPVAPSVAPLEDGGGTSRINVRLPDQLKQRVEEAAGREGLSVNAWLVRAAAAALEPRPLPPVASRGSRATASGQTFTGWAR